MPEHVEPQCVDNPRDRVQPVRELDVPWAPPDGVDDHRRRGWIEMFVWFVRSWKTRRFFQAGIGHRSGPFARKEQTLKSCDASPIGEIRASVGTPKTLAESQRSSME